jgi:phosphohistidine phosphatase
MKTLILVRHAKSSWTEPGLADRDRVLNDRGRRNAPEMGKRLAKGGLKPDVILSSPAVRALTTAQLLAEELDYKRSDIRVDDRLYAAEADELVRVVGESGDGPQRVMVVGHNPEMTELARRLSGTIDHMPTCAVAVFTFDIASWRDLPAAEARSTAFHTPKSRPLP